MNQNSKTLSMKYMGLLNDPSEWCILEAVYFACNLKPQKKWICRLTYLKKNTPIKRDDSLLKHLNRMSESGWLTKTPYGRPIKIKQQIVQRYQYIADQRTIDAKFETMIQSPTENVGLEKQSPTESGGLSPTESGGLSPTESVGQVLRKAEDIGNKGHSLGKDLGKRETKEPVFDWRSLDFSKINTISDLADTKEGRCLIEIVKKREALAKEYEWPDSLTYDREIIIRDTSALLNRHRNLMAQYEN